MILPNSQRSFGDVFYRKKIKIFSMRLPVHVILRRHAPSNLGALKKKIDIDDVNMLTVTFWVFYCGKLCILP